MREKISKIAAIGVASVAAYAVALTSVAAQSDYYYTTAADDAAASAFLGGTSLFFCCFSVVILVVWLGLAYWVYKDAKKNNPDQAVLWAVLTLVLGVVGIILYLVAGRKKS